MTTGDMERRIAALEERFEREMGVLRTENACLRGDAPSPLPGPRPTRLSRRGLLGMAGAGAATLAATAGTLHLTGLTQARAAARPADNGGVVVNYQGRLTDNKGKLITGTYPMIFALYTQPNGGPAVWTEQHIGTNGVPVKNGLFSVYLGSLTPLTPSLLAITPVYLGITVGNDAEMAPREQLGSVPFAMQAQEAGHASTADSATNAQNAAQAGHATTADSATKADNADTVSGYTPPFSSAALAPTITSSVLTNGDFTAPGDSQWHASPLSVVVNPRVNEYLLIMVSGTMWYTGLNIDQMVVTVNGTPILPIVQHIDRVNTGQDHAMAITTTYPVDGGQQYTIGVSITALPSGSEGTVALCGSPSTTPGNRSTSLIVVEFAR